MEPEMILRRIAIILYNYDNKISHKDRKENKMYRDISDLYDIIHNSIMDRDY